MAVGKPVLYSTTTTSTITTTTTEAPIPDVIELAGTTTEYNWKDNQLLGLYNLEGYRHGAPYYKRYKNAVILGEIYFYFSPGGCWPRWSSDFPCWVVARKGRFEETPLSGSGWLWKESPG